MRALALLIAFLGLVVPAQAGFVFTIGSVTSVAGSTFVVPVTVSTPDGSQFGAGGGFNLAFDLFPSGTGLFAGITPNAIQVTGGPLFASPSINHAFDGTFLMDGLVNSNTSTGVLLINNVPSTVFNLQFDVASSVAPGTYAINFSSNGLTSVTDSTGAQLVLNPAPGVNGYTLNSGSITVTAVPEPTSLALAGSMVVFATGYAGRRRLRRTKSAV